MTYASQENLMSNENYKIKIRQAMVKVALDLVGEAATVVPATDTIRHNLGVEILNNINTHEEAFYRAAVANGVLSDSSTDQDFYNAVSAVYNDIAGV